MYSRGNPDLTASVGPARLDSLFDMAQAILERLRMVAKGAGVALPGRQVIYPSAIPTDCEQVAVLLTGWSPHVVWDGYVNCQTFKWAGNFQVTITRCSPGTPDKRGKIPDAATMTDAARVASVDAGLLQQLVATFAEIGPEMSLIVSSPEAGLQSVELTVSLTTFGSLD